MIGASYRPLEEAPYPFFYGVGVDVTPYPFLGTMVDRLVRGVVVGNPTFETFFVPKLRPSYTWSSRILGILVSLDMIIIARTDMAC